MGFLDRFKRKKAVLIHEEHEVANYQPPRKQNWQQANIESAPAQVIEVQESASPQSKVQDSDERRLSITVTSRDLAIKNSRKKKRAKKKRVMKKRARPKRRKAAKRTLRPRPLDMEDGTTAKKWLQKDRELLGGALRDLNRELQSLRSARKRLELKMDAYSSSY